MNKETFEKYIIDNPNHTKICPSCNENKLYSTFRWCSRSCKVCEYKRNKSGMQSYYLKNKDHCLKVKKQTDQEDPQSYLWKVVKSRAKIRNIPFNIDKSDIIIPEFCPVLGLKLSLVRGNDVTSNKANSPSVDKVNNKLGYIKGNIRVISYRANQLKNDATIEELEKVIAYIKDFQC